MSTILSSLRNTVITGIILMLLIVFFVNTASGNESVFVMPDIQLAFIMRYIHVLSGVMWIGILWYFNFIQIPTMPSIPDALKPAIGKHIAPEALFWFRWGAMFTIISGLILAYMNGYVHQALMLSPEFRIIGIGMWMGIIMWFNVWFIIWPNQKIALGMVEADADAKAASARKAMLFSRTNTLLSIPMLYCMISFHA